MVTSVPTRETIRQREKTAGAMATLGLIMEAVRERGGLVQKPKPALEPEVLFHWRLRNPIFVWRDPVTGRFLKKPVG